MRLSEREVRAQVGNIDLDEVATTANQLARQLGATRPAVIAEGTPGDRTFTVDDSLVAFIQNTAQPMGGGGGLGGPEARNTFGF